MSRIRSYINDFLIKRNYSYLFFAFSEYIKVLSSLMSPTFKFSALFQVFILTSVHQRVKNVTSMSNLAPEEAKSRHKVRNLDTVSLE